MCADGMYEGNWRDDKRYGWGKMTFANGSVYEGEWKDTRCMEKGNLHLLMEECTPRESGRMTSCMEKGK